MSVFEIISRVLLRRHVIDFFQTLCQLNLFETMLFAVAFFRVIGFVPLIDTSTDADSIIPSCLASPSHRRIQLLFLYRSPRIPN